MQLQRRLQRPLLKFNFFQILHHYFFFFGIPDTNRYCYIYLGVILQLSSLSSHAEDLFGELFTEASAFYARATKLQDRIDRLNNKVQSLDSNVEEGRISGLRHQ